MEGWSAYRRKRIAVSVNELYRTKSVCPVCLSVLDASVTERDGAVYLSKECKEHGPFKTVIWRDSGASYLEWLRYGGWKPEEDLGAVAGCPDHCGSCMGHRQEVCSAAVMVTNRCNSACPVCFTVGKEARFEPSLEELTGQFLFYRKAGGENFPLELCGGEPMVRDDLPQIAAKARELGFSYIQVNTNGIRAASDPDYLIRLKEAGVTTLYLGLDGVTSGPYLKKYGKDIFPLKIKALENSAAAGLAVVLVPCVIPGSNEKELGAIIRLAKEFMPTVRGVYFQPVSYFGTYPKPPEDSDRITIPEVLRLLEEQTGGEVRREHFLPGNCEHPQCSFGAYYMEGKDGRLRAVTRYQALPKRAQASAHVREVTRKNWTPGKNRHLTIGGMAFQDAWNLDLARLSRCTVQIVGRDGRLIPLCAKYLTNCQGEKLYPGIS